MSPYIAENELACCRRTSFPATGGATDAFPPRENDRIRCMGCPQEEVGRTSLELSETSYRIARRSYVLLCPMSSEGISLKVAAALDCSAQDLRRSGRSWLRESAKAWLGAALRIGNRRGPRDSFAFFSSASSTTEPLCTTPPPSPPAGPKCHLLTVCYLILTFPTYHRSPASIPQADPLICTAKWTLTHRPPLTDSFQQRSELNPGYLTRLKFHADSLYFFFSYSEIAK